MVKSNKNQKKEQPMKAYERLLNYVKINTKSSEESGTHPSTESQFALANALADELEKIICKI